MRELTELTNHISVVALDDANDEWVFIWGTGTFSSRAAYRCLTESGVEDQHAGAIWETRVPAKVRFFGWLLCNDRLSTRSKLLHKNCLKPEEAFCVRCPSTIEDAHHIFYDCPPAASTWDRIGFSTSMLIGQMSWCLDVPTALPSSFRNDIILAVHWRIWLARNNKVFNAHDDDSSAILRAVTSDLELWRYRYKTTDRGAIDT